MDNLSARTMGWVTNVRRRIETEKFNTLEPTTKQIQRVAIEVNARIKDKGLRKQVLTAILGMYVDSQYSLSFMMHSILIDELTKYPDTMAILQELELFCAENKETPTGSLLILDEDYNTRTRMILSAKLLFERGQYDPIVKSFVVCPICGEKIQSIGDMHEALISRGDVQGAPDNVKQMIFSRYNCIHRHNQCPTGGHFHAPGIGGSETFEKCARALVEYEGYEGIYEWLVEMANVLPKVGSMALQRFTSIEFEEEE